VIDMNIRRDNIRHFRTRMAIHIISDAHGGLGRPLWVIAREYIWNKSFGGLGINPDDAARIMRAIGMGKKSIRRACALPA
jgi:hypothetical protein